GHVARGDGGGDLGAAHPRGARDRTADALRHGWLPRADRGRGPGDRGAAVAGVERGGGGEDGRERVVAERGDGARRGDRGGAGGGAGGGGRRGGPLGGGGRGARRAGPRRD